VRRLGFLLPRLAFALAVFLAVFHMFLTQSAAVQSLMVQNVHLGVSVALIGLTAATAGGTRKMAWGIGIAALGLAIMAYIWLEFETLIRAQGFPRPHDVAIGVLLIAVVFEATRQRWGLVLPVLASITLAYYLLGHHLPPAWGAPMTPLPTAISNLSIGLYSGTFGTFMAISANDVFLFMLFGGLLETLDGNRPFTELGKSISRRLPGGAGLTTVVSSGMMGMVTGAAVSNVAVCGTYTIPWMKRDGYPPETAAAIEATASTGGQLVPPVMGSVAFIMAALLAVPYWDIVVSAVYPAIFFYVSVFAAVYFASRRLGIPRKPVGADPLQLLFHLPLFVVPLIVMTVLLAQLRSVAYAAFYAIVTLVLLRFAMVFVARTLPLRLQDRLRDEGESAGLTAGLAALFAKLRLGLYRGVLQGASIAVVLGTVGVLSECVTATGAAVPLGWAVEALAGDSLFIALLATAVMCIVLGAGIPTVGAYVLTAAIAGPIVTDHGLDIYAAHFFILYYACLSAITPPVAAAALAASAIAGTSYMRTAWQATLIAAMLYMLPFLFVYEQALLNKGDYGPLQLSALLVEVTVLCVLVSAASQGFLLARLGWATRIALWLAALGIALHVCGAGVLPLAAGAVLLGVVLALQVSARRRDRTPGTAAAASRG
jgi:TRAP transporter 4TM/12TM fusion protein